MISKQYRHTGTIAKDLRIQVRIDEKEAAKELGGKVVRTTKFVNSGEDIVVTWRLQ